MKKDQLISIAKEFNLATVLGLEPPIDVKNAPTKLVKTILEAATYLNEKDELSEETTKNLQELFLEKLDVIEAIRANGGPLLEKTAVTLGHPIKTAGKHKIEVKLLPTVAASVTLEVVPA